MKFAITVGLPCAGKSEFCRYLSKKEPHIIVNPDTIRTAMFGEIEVAPGAEPHIWATAQTMARHFLLMGFNVIIDAANLSREGRKTWVKMAKEFKVELDIYWINTSYSVCKRVNELRGCIPRKVLEDMSSRLEYPTEKEGNVITITPVYSERQGDSFGKFKSKAL